MRNGKLDDSRLEEIADGLMQQFRTVKSHTDDVEMEMKIYDSMSNGAGKILKAYMIDIAMAQLSEPKRMSLPEVKQLAIGAD